MDPIAFKTIDAADEMNRFKKMLFSGTKDEPNQPAAKSTATTGDPDQHNNRDNDMQRIPSFKQGGGSKRGLGRVFRRNKSESSVLKKKDAMQFTSEDDISKAFSEGTRSTLSLSMASKRSDLSLSMASNFRASEFSHYRRSEIIRNIPIEESEHSTTEEDHEVVARAPAIDESDEEVCKGTPPADDYRADEAAVANEEVVCSLPSDNDGADEVARTSLAQEEPLVNPPTIDYEPPRAPGYILEKQDLAELGYLEFPFSDISEACTVAESTGKPIFAFHTTLPGDEDVGEEIFSHPVIVEAIQTLFVPVLCIEEVTADTPVRRSSSGRRCRASVLIMEATSLELLIDDPLVGDTLTKEDVLGAMVKALEKLGNCVPKYLQVLQKGEISCEEKRLVVGTGDPARAEIEFVTLEGVVAVSSNLWTQQRVVVVNYDPRRITFSMLVRHAVQHSLCDTVYHLVNEERIAAQIESSRLRSPPALLPLQGGYFDRDIFSKHALRKTSFRFVPLTRLQSALANRLVQTGRFNEAMHLLSPFQGQMLMQAMRSGPSEKRYFEVVDVPILVAWKSFCEQKHPSAFYPPPEPDSLFYDSDDDNFEL